MKGKAQLGFNYLNQETIQKLPCRLATGLTKECKCAKNCSSLHSGVDQSYRIQFSGVATFKA